MIKFDIPCQFPKKYLNKVHKTGMVALDGEMTKSYIQDCFKDAGGTMIDAKLHMDIIIVYPYYSSRLSKVSKVNEDILAPDIDLTVDKIYKALSGLAFPTPDCITQLDVAKIHGIDPKIIVTLISLEEISNGEFQ